MLLYILVISSKFYDALFLHQNKVGARSFVVCIFLLAVRIVVTNSRSVES
jgi:hypothetical protein